VTPTQLGNIEAELHVYLRNKDVQISTEFSAVVDDVIVFTSAVVKTGLRKALANLPNGSDGLADRPFIEVADVVVEHHLRWVPEGEREITRKSLLEAYFHACGPQYVFEPPAKTQFFRSLRRQGPREFGVLLLSLHLFNTISIAIQDEVRLKMTDIRSFEVYMLGLEAVCRDMVKAAIESSDRSNLSKHWIHAVVNHIHGHLIHVASPAT